MEVTFANSDLDRLETDPGFNGGLPAEIVRMYRKRMQVHARKRTHTET